MPRASPNKLSWNAGEFSTLFEGRVDYKKYPASARSLVNCVITPQGPIIGRSGTNMQVPVYDESKHSQLVDYVFSDEQALMLEFADFRVRFHSEDGLLLKTVDTASILISTTPFVINSAALIAAGAAVGYQVLLDGFDDASLLNGRVATVLATGMASLTLDIVPTTFIATGGTITASLVYHIDSPYAEADVLNITGLQDIDIMYLFCPGYRVYKLRRRSAFDWSIKEVIFVDGPHIAVDKDCPLLTPDITGIATADHTGYTSATGTVSASSEDTPAWYAFDREIDNFWRTATVQSGTLTYTFAVPTVIQGYIIYVARNNDNGAFSSKDRAPGTWKFQAFDGAQWITLDEKFEYTLYTNYRTPYIRLNNKIAYGAYRLLISECVTPGDIKCSVGEFVMREAGPIIVNLVADATTSINDDAGFLSTDVGRLLRLYQTDGFWRSSVITSVTDTTHIAVRLQDGPLLNTEPIRQWRLGYFSDTTGWPTCGTWFADRLALGGIASYPTLVAISKPGDGFYEIFSETDPDGTVNDDNAIAATIKSRKQSIIRWLGADDKLLLIGTSGSEWSIGPNTESQPFSARNSRARPSSRRGSAAVKPVVIDRQVLFANALKRTIYEHSYELASDGYKSQSMSLLASHLGIKGFEQLIYSQEPHNIVWVRRASKDIVGLTYNRDEDVVGWHTHNFADGEVESGAVIPSTIDKQHTLWVVTRRIINGVPRRYVERLTRTWDFQMLFTEDACFVDCSLRAIFDTPTDVVYVPHLKGCIVQGLVDGIPFGLDNEITVDPVTAKCQLPYTGYNVIVGLPYETSSETQRAEAGGAEGTSQGKTKRTDEVVVFLWDSAYGQVGVMNEDQRIVEWADIPYEEAGHEITSPPQPFTGMVGPFAVPGGYGKLGTLRFRQNAPLPFNIISVLPRMETQDGG